MKKKLIISTETFPYGKGEKTFILPELEKLAKIYDITIVSHAHADILLDTQDITKLPPEINVINISLSINIIQRFLYVLRYLLDADGWREITDIIKSKEKILSRIYQSIGFYALASENLSQMEKKGILNNTESTVYYTFWFYYYTYSLTKKRKKYKNMKIVTRTHGFDLYNERYTGGRQPFKRIMTENIDKIIFIAEAGKKYYEKVYEKNNAGKYIVSRLGTKERDKLSVQNNCEDIFRLVSCSSVIPLKRIQLIIDALALLENERVDWLHFGDGADYLKIKKYAEEQLSTRENISFQLMGFMTNEKILEYYENNRVDCFITTSSTEGIPVSIQEAMSLGIPVIGTDVGGISEMIDGNGELLDANPDTHEIAEAIRRMYYLEDEERNKLRNRSYEIWKNLFWEEKNVNEFIHILNDL